MRLLYRSLDHWNELQAGCVHREHLRDLTCRCKLLDMCSQRTRRGQELGGERVMKGNAKASCNARADGVDASLRMGLPNLAVGDR